jgi:hypothetical protein
MHFAGQLQADELHQHFPTGPPTFMTASPSYLGGILHAGLEPLPDTGYLRALPDHAIFILFWTSGLLKMSRSQRFELSQPLTERLQSSERYGRE